ncbi:MAG: (Fe-S)-binding protein [Candidatus Nezhaarchaeales archaeon]
MKALYWAGCTLRYRFPDLVEDHVKLLEKIGYEVVKLSDEGCCGDPLLLIGSLDEAERVIHDTSEQIAKANVDLLITGCAGCYHAFKKYREFEARLPPFKHITQALAESLSKFSFAEPKEKVTYHDPCELGRLSGEFEAPRKVLQAASTLIEPLTSGREALCCGGGGGLWAVAPELSIRMAEVRLERDIEPLGVSKLITACPTCLLNLGIAAERRLDVTKRPIEVVELGRYILSRLR